MGCPILGEAQLNVALALKSASVSFDNSMGLNTQKSMPASMQRSNSSFPECPVSAMIGIEL